MLYIFLKTKSHFNFENQPLRNILEYSCFENIRKGIPKTYVMEVFFSKTLEWSFLKMGSI